MIELEIKAQPDDETCGPTSLHAVYRYYGDDIPLMQVVSEMEYVKTGGTNAVLLGKHALSRGYNATILAYNISLFDPSWFEKRKFDKQFLIDKLTEQLQYKQSHQIVELTHGYIEYLKLGGLIVFKDLTVSLLKHYFESKIPILTGLSATYLYHCAREVYTPDGKAAYEDVRGEPTGHFVVLCGYDETKRHVIVADPHRANPISHNNYYKVNIGRLINAIMLGILTYDANLLLISPKGHFNEITPSDR